MKKFLSITMAIFMILLLIPTSIAEETEPTVLPTAKIGDQYSQTIVKDFPDTGVQPFTLSKGELPKNMDLEAIQMEAEEERVFHIQLIGCPLSDGTFNFTVKLYTEEERNFELTVTKGDCTFLPDGMVGTEYAETLKELQADETYKQINETSTCGLELTVKTDETAGTSCLMLTGTPTESGIFVFDICYTTVDNHEATHRYIVAVEDKAVILEDAYTGTPYKVTLLSGVQNPEDLTVEPLMGDAVPGLDLAFNQIVDDPNKTGRIILEGLPLQAGVYRFTVNYEVLGESGKENKSEKFKLTVIEDAIMLPTASSYHEYSEKVMDLPGSDTDINYSWDGKPIGIEVDRKFNEDSTASELFLIGTPKEEGVYVFTIIYDTNTEAPETITTKFILVIESGIRKLSVGTYKQNYSTALIDDDGNTKVSVIEGKLPEGLTIVYDASPAYQGNYTTWIVIEGIPTEFAEFIFTLEYTRGEEKWTELCLIDIGHLAGDANGDGIPNTGDAVEVLKHCAEIKPIDTRFEKAADANNDGIINTADAVAILRHAAGIE